MGAEDFLASRGGDLATLATAAAHCRGCALSEHASVTVFGEGPARAPLLLVGERPGDREDREGTPFVGPAGRVLDEALEAAGVGRASVYVTNAVKHFKWVPKGGRRLHEKPSAREVAACSPWLRAEIAAVEPRLVGLLGATAARSLLGAAFKVTEHRGELVEGPGGTHCCVTVHPSSILRGAPSERERAMAPSWQTSL